MGYGLGLGLRVYELEAIVDQGMGQVKLVGQN